MSKLKENFERLMNFAAQSGFHKPFSQVYLVEQKSILRFYDSDQIVEISRQDIFTSEKYETRFDEILTQGHSWVNMNFAGILNNNLLVVIETPNYENNCEFTSVNFSGISNKVLERDYSLDSFFKVI